MKLESSSNYAINYSKLDSCSTRFKACSNSILVFYCWPKH